MLYFGGGKLAGAAFGAASDAAARYHWAGSAGLSGHTNLPTLDKIFALPSSPAVCDLVVAKVSGMLAKGLNLGTNSAVSALLEPLLNDLLESESLGTFGEAVKSPPDFIVAAHLDQARVQLWQDNLEKILGATGEKFTAGEFSGWRWKTAAAGAFWILPARGWLLAGRGDGFSSIQSDYLQRLKSEGRPVSVLGANWLEADVDWTRLAFCSPGWLQLLKPARMNFTLAPDQDNLRLAARLVYPEAMPWKPAPWNLPIARVSGPLTSFTAAKDVAPFLNLSSVFGRLDGNPFANQFCVWGLTQVPFLTFAAWPVSDPTNVLRKLAPEVVDSFGAELKEFNGTQLTWQTNPPALFLANLGVITPVLRAVKDTNGEYLFLFLFPTPATGKPLPDGLWKQVDGRANLVYYDWELTGPRLQEWRLLGRMLLLPTQRPVKHSVNARQVEEKWQGQLIPLLGNTVTEATQVAPNELSLVRTGPLGLTAVEIFLLSDWLSSSGEAVHSPPRSK